MQVSVREYGCLTVDGDNDGLDSVTVSLADFESLRKWVLMQPPEKSSIFKLSSRRGLEIIQACNYVGLIETSEGFRVEILPKTSMDEESPERARALLWKMLAAVRGIDATLAGNARVGTLKYEWLEALIGYVLAEISRLVRRGICSDYLRCDDKTKFLKGQLRVSKQVRMRPGTLDRFHVSYDRYLPDRPENRLIHLCLQRLGKWSQLAENQRLCRELLFMFSEVEGSTNIKRDLESWSDRRDMAHYQPVHPWVKLILSGEAPVFSQGEWSGISLLFPMEELFEKYVEHILRRKLSFGHHLQSQARSEHLVKHRGVGWFQLKPDILIRRGADRVAVLDTKWKMLDQTADDRKKKYNITQADLYQLFAYGEKYLSGSGDLFLIYPAHDKFSEPLPVFEFHEGLRLWVVPFDTHTNEFVEGDWINQAQWLESTSRQVA